MYDTGPTALLPFRRKSCSGFLRSEKNPSTPAAIEPANLGSRGEYDNHCTTGVDIDRLAKGDQGMRVTLGIHGCPALQEVYEKGAVLLKEERHLKLPALVWIALDIFGGGDPGCFHWRLCRFDSGSK